MRRKRKKKIKIDIYNDRFYATPMKEFINWEEWNKDENKTNKIKKIKSNSK